MKVARIVVGIVGLISAAFGIISVLFAIISLLDGLWLTALAFGIVAAVPFGLAVGAWAIWKAMAPRPAAARRHEAAE